MNRQELYDAWAPLDSPWSTWAKPVAFVRDTDPGPITEADSPDALADLSWAPADRTTALVLDLPGGEAVRLGARLAGAGFRPVPLFNGTHGPSPVIPTEDIARALAAGALAVRTSGAPLDAPPAFLLDARRMPAAQPTPGQFDNRWLVFPQDFPSAAFLGAHGVRAVLVVRAADESIPEDLAHVLLRWQQAGLALHVRALAPGAATRELAVAKPRGFRTLWHRILAVMRLKRNSTGGFGAVVPLAATGGHYG